MIDRLKIGADLRVRIDEVDEGIVKISPVEPLPGYSARLARKGRKEYEAGQFAQLWIVDIQPSTRIIVVSDSDFGKKTVSPGLRPQYKRALTAGIALLTDPSALDQKDAADLSNLKGMYSRFSKKDQWDWYTVWGYLERPHPTAVEVLPEALDKAARLLRTDSRQELETLARQFPPDFADLWERSRSRIEGTALQIPNSKRRPSRSKLSESRPATSWTRTYDDEKTKRASMTHQIVVERLKSELELRGFTPHEHDLVDVFCELATGPAIFEVKSLTSENEQAQARHAYAQAFYYRFVTGQSRPG